jgi:Fe-S-cluster containining protein
MQQILQTRLETIASISIEKQKENDAFIDFLKKAATADLDNMVCLLNEQITPQIDCTTCGNCCKSLMIVVEENEADHLSQHLNQSRENFDAQYIEKGSNGMMLINKIPCHFLSDNKCTVYEHRFAGCKEFPAMHLPNFKERLFTTFMHYNRCPIIFNVVEELKLTTGFKS